MFQYFIIIFHTVEDKRSGRGKEEKMLLTYIAMKTAEIPAYYTETRDQTLLSQA